ncbi:SDR family NAD(P)-dependent oxidoreductase [Falsibacillus pallidus]|uniref:SDR family NAD(P)-dependent oxidoreductase n=1 Tax=Falsibacillus pallidus TaxID=493781 RepID=UPI003D99B27B
MTNKVMLIIGAGPGVSLNAAKKFGKEGFQIALIARRKDALEQYTKDLSDSGIEAKGFTGDIASGDSLKNAIQEVINTYGSIDTLLYNAAAGKPGKPTELSAEDLLADFNISVAGALTAVKEVVPHMENGTILLTGGGLAIQPYADYASLAVGKAGIRNLAYSLNQELSAKDIYVGTLTIAGFVQEGTYFSAENIADAFYEMYVNRTDVEVVYQEN